MRQQEVVASLGRRALGESSLFSLMEEAVAAAGQTLAVDSCQVLELLPGEDKPIFTARAGWPEELAGKQAPVDVESHAGDALVADEALLLS